MCVGMHAFDNNVSLFRIFGCVIFMCLIACWATFFWQASAFIWREETNFPFFSRNSLFITRECSYKQKCNINMYTVKYLKKIFTYIFFTFLPNILHWPVKKNLRLIQFHVWNIFFTVNKNQRIGTVCRYLFTAKLLYMFRVS